MNKRLSNYLIIILCGFILMLPLIFGTNYVLDDTIFHYGNIKFMLESMNGLKISNIIPYICNNLGYGTRLFYPQLSHVFIVYLCKLFSLSVLNGIKLGNVIMLILSGITMYNLSYRLSKSNKVALLSGLLYMTYPYHLTDIYIRGSLGESFSFVFYPIILEALTYLFSDKKKFMILFVIGYLGGMYTHFTMMIYFTILLIPFFIIERKRVFTKDILITLIESASIILLIYSPNLVNLFQNKFIGNYRVFQSGVMAQGIWHDGLYFQYFDYFHLFDNIITKLYGESEINGYFGLISIILLIITIKYRKELFNKDYKFYIIFGLLALFGSSILFPWDILPEMLRMIQFPWRLLTFVGIIISLVAPLCIDKIKFNSYYLIIPIILLALLFNTKSLSTELLDEDNINYYWSMGWQQEYLNSNAYDNLDYINNRDNLVHVNNGYSNIAYNYGDILRFSISEDTEVELPRLYYFGYTLKDIDGNTYDIYQNDNGLISADLKSGSYILEYTGTKIHNIFKNISIITIILSITYYIYLFYVDRKKKVLD